SLRRRPRTGHPPRCSGGGRLGKLREPYRERLDAGHEGVDLDALLTGVEAAAAGAEPVDGGDAQAAGGARVAATADEIRLSIPECDGAAARPVRRQPRAARRR